MLTIAIMPQLLDKCLQAVDVELYDHLRSKNLSAELYAFPCTSAAFHGDGNQLMFAC